MNTNLICVHMVYSYPILIVSPHGTIAVYLRENCIVEMTINKMIRVECQGKFSAATNPFGNINCILHPDGRILQHDTRVQCLFGKNKVASFGPQVKIHNCIVTLFLRRYSRFILGC